MSPHVVNVLLPPLQPRIALCLIKQELFFFLRRLFSEAKRVGSLKRDNRTQNRKQGIGKINRIRFGLIRFGLIRFGLIRFDSEEDDRRGGDRQGLSLQIYFAVLAPFLRSNK